MGLLQSESSIKRETLKAKLGTESCREGVIHRSVLYVSGRKGEGERARPYVPGRLSVDDLPPNTAFRF